MGRVGDSGEYKNTDYADLKDALSDFKKKFQDKTRNKWEEREDFQKVSGKYDLIILR